MLSSPRRIIQDTAGYYWGESYQTKVSTPLCGMLTFVCICNTKRHKAICREIMLIIYHIAHLIG